MRIAALLVTLFTIVVGMVGIVSPDSVTTVRRQYFATPIGLYAAGAVRVAMGLVLILVAPTSRAPKTLRALGAVVCMQGFAAQLFGLDRARDPRMGGDAYRAPAHRGRRSFGHWGLRSVCGWSWPPS